MTAQNEGLSAVETLNGAHELDEFNCGKAPLNRFLKHYALTNQKAESARTYVVCRGKLRVVGYYSLTVGAVEHIDAPRRVSKGLARHPIPVMLLARLAIDTSEHRQGLGKALLKDALLRTAQAADITGIRALLIHAKDEAARSWYERFDFEASPTDACHLFLLMKDLRAQIGEE